ncbi:hypothetical protein JFT91_28150 [Pseudomonas sp. TH08]|uniref:hypothetical protein n=1 Tax=unclassified Pseudomonas TaxID=196821 RepID=UPI0019130835|nr:MULTISPECIES: hypothetical protein [unclassified Pseudomonas]MBK5529930.1 hypothetical protein [Pseudomonas sp. TH06]MBK5536408.1 hypothetical protein [Pseudomonas sp. TH08]
MKTVQLMISEGKKMRKDVKKAPSKKGPRKADEKLGDFVLSTNQRRFLQVLVDGIDVDEPNVLAGRR